MSRLTIAAAALIAAAATTPATSAAATDIATFSGRCVGSGLVRTGAPLTVVPVLTSIEFTSTGTCTGVLNGHTVVNAPFAGRSVSARALLSCAGGQASGDSSLSIRDADGGWTTLRLRFDDVNVLGTSAFTLRGDSGGSGWGQHQLTPDLPMVTACLGAGIDEVGNTVSLATITPFEG